VEDVTLVVVELPDLQEPNVEKHCPVERSFTLTSITKATEKL
jgi:hypothetical protein